MAHAILKPSKRLDQRKAALRGTSKPAMAKLKKAATAGSKPVATEPDAAEIAEREAVARTFFNPTAARAARSAFLKR